MSDNATIEHEKELQRVHNMFNQEIRELKEIYNMKISNLEMRISDIEMRHFLIQKDLVSIVNKLNLK